MPRPKPAIVHTTHTSRNNAPFLPHDQHHHNCKTSTTREEEEENTNDNAHIAVDPHGNRETNGRARPFFLWKRGATVCRPIKARRGTHIREAIVPSVVMSYRRLVHSHPVVLVMTVTLTQPQQQKHSRFRDVSQCYENTDSIGYRIVMNTNNKKKYGRIIYKA